MGKADNTAARRLRRRSVEVVARPNAADPTSSPRAEIAAKASPEEIWARMRADPEAACGVCLPEQRLKSVRARVAELQLPPGHAEQVLRAVFERCDENGDGRITSWELARAIRHDTKVAAFFKLPTKVSATDGSKKTYEQVFASIDEDADGSISWPEFAAKFAGHGGYTPTAQHDMIADTTDKVRMVVVAVLLVVLPVVLPVLVLVLAVPLLLTVSLSPSLPLSRSAATRWCRWT